MFFTNNEKAQAVAALGASVVGISSFYNYEIPVWMQLGIGTYALARMARVTSDERAKQ